MRRFFLERRKGETADAEESERGGRRRRRRRRKACLLALSCRDIWWERGVEEV